MRYLRNLSVLALIFCWTIADATHIIGGFISYEYLGNNQYSITVTMYRDCNPGNTGFDTPAIISILNSDGSLNRTLSLSPSISEIEPTLDNPCLVIPPHICVEEGVYTRVVTLAPAPGGYDIVFQRCCRNHLITNIPNPGAVGATFTAHIPGTGNFINNSSPVFNNFPPIVICVNEPFEVDQSATDIDGDSLAYSLCAPYVGGSQPDPVPNPPSSPPYATIPYLPPYSGPYPMDANPALHIDSVTGLLTAVPTVQGQFVVGICIREYRNGVLIGTYLRDFQFNPTYCPEVAVIGTLPDTFKLCRPFEITFDNQSNNSNQYFWNFGDPTTTADTSTQFEPTYTYPDTGHYTLRLIATNDDGCKDTTYADVHIRQALRSNFTYVRACPGDPVQFSDASTSEAGNIVQWKWYFGDGDSSTLQNPSHVYAGTGPYQVTLKILTDIGCEEQYTQNVTFYRKPVAQFSRGIACLFEPTQFNDQSTVQNASIANLAWNFGLPGANSSQENPSYVYTQPGTYTVTLISTSSQGCKDTVEKTLTINPIPDAQVAFSDTSVCRQNQVTLVASGGLFYQWKPATYLNNPNIATPTATPNSNITYTVLVSDSCHTDSTIIHVELLPEPDPDFTFNLKCVGEPITFTDQSTPGMTGGINTWLWNFGDGSSSNDQNPSHIFTGNGPYQVRLTVTNDTGCSLPIVKTVAPYTLPDVGFSIQTTPCLNDPVVFNDLTTTDSGTVVSWQWNFDDGTPPSTMQHVTHTYTSPGLYDVTLRAVTSFGCVDTIQKLLTINDYPLADVSNDTSACPGKPVPLQATGGLFYSWRPAAGLDDSTLANPTAIPSVTTTYTVVVSDSCYADSTTVTVSLFPEPTANFQVDLGCTKDTVSFVDQSTTPGGSSLAGWDWDFGDGQSSSDQDPVNIYAANGSYDVTLIVTNNFTCQDTISKTVTPYPIADTDFSFDSIPCLQKPVQFTDESTLVSGSITGWNWNFGDGSGSAAQQNPQHTYMLPNTYTVQLVTTTNNGCKDTATQMIEIDPFVVAQVSPDTSICSLDTATLRALGGLYYQWSPATMTNPDTSAVTVVSPNQPTVFTVTVSDNCWSDSATVLVDIFEWPDVQVYQDTSIYKGETATFEALVGPGVTAYQWEPVSDIVGGTGSSSSIEVQPDTLTWYTLKVTDIHGCQNIDSAFVGFLNPLIAVPNAFTPNGDQLNDRFYVLSRGEVDILDFRVYNRWGQVVYETNGLATPSNGWDGTFKGEPQPAGSYTYVIRAVPVLVQGAPLEEHGSVTLIR